MKVVVTPPIGTPDATEFSVEFHYEGAEQISPIGLIPSVQIGRVVVDRELQQVMTNDPIYADRLEMEGKDFVYPVKAIDGAGREVYGGMDVQEASDALVDWLGKKAS